MSRFFTAVRPFSRWTSRLPLLLLGPSLGRPPTTLWAAAARTEPAASRWSAGTCPGTAPGAGGRPLSVAELAEDVLGSAAWSRVRATRAAFHYAGDSIGGAVGLQLLLDPPGLPPPAALHRRPDRDPGELAGAGRARSGPRAPGRSCPTAAQTPWFGPGFADREPARRRRAAGPPGRHRRRLVRLGLRGAGRLRRDRPAGGEIRLAGGRDRRRVRHQDSPSTGCGRSPPGVSARPAHRARPGGATWPRPVAAARAALIVGYLLRRPPRPGTGLTVAEVQAAGHRVRREVLGNPHVDRAVDRTTALDRDFQDLIESATPGARSGPGPASTAAAGRSPAVTALVARGHHQELAMHLRAART